jgi:hypothetical protein
VEFLADAGDGYAAGIVAAAWWKRSLMAAR